MSGSSEELVKPRGNLRVCNTAEVTKAGDLKNNYPITIINRADIAEERYYFAGGPWCFNDPERKQRTTIVGCCLKR